MVPAKNEVYDRGPVIARGPVFKKNFIAEKVLGIDSIEIYSLMCFILDVNLGMLYNSKNIRVTIDDDFYKRRLVIIENTNFVYYVNYVLPNYAKFQWELEADQRKKEETISYMRGMTSIKNEVYVLILLVILMFFIIIVQLNT